MDWSLAPWTLTWDEVDPGRHPFDPDSAPGAVRSLDPAPEFPLRLPPGQPDDRNLLTNELTDWVHDAADPWADSMTRAMVERWGRWATGWRWARDEGDFGGGPVAGWCCAIDSITGAEETLARVSGALVEWRSWLEELAACFERYPLASLATPEDLAVWGHGAIDLVHRVVVRTGAGDAWYRHCAQVLAWYLARWGFAEQEARHLVEEAIGGQFESWVGPAETAVNDMATRLGRAAGNLDHEHGER
jgi:hypothetical protein